MNKFFLLIAVLLYTIGWLLWEHFNGGVLTHHLLQQKDLPGISNWWGLIWLPALTWILLSRIESRKSRLKAGQSKRVFHTGLFLAGLILGVLLAVCFRLDIKIVLDNFPYLLLLLSLLIPIFYAEFIGGFVLAVTPSFGPILPTLFILVIAGLAFLVYRFIRPLFARLILRPGK